MLNAEEENYLVSEQPEVEQELPEAETVEGANVESQAVEDGDDESHSDTPDYMKKHFRRFEKKIKQENRELNDRLAVAQHQLNQYGELFQSTYANAYQGQLPEEPKDEVEARVLDIIKRRDTQAEEQRRAAAQKRQEQEMLDALTSTLDQGAEVYDDFEDVVHDRSLPLSKDIAIAATFLPNGADVLYSLAKNRDELNRINSITDYQKRMKALTTYAFNLTKGDKVLTSKAPKPTSNPQIQSKPSAKQTDVSRMTYEQLKAKSKADMLNKQRRR